MRLNKVLIYITEDKIYLEVDGNYYSYEYNDIGYDLEDILKELNVSSDYSIYLVADICFFDIANNKLYIKNNFINDIKKLKKRIYFKKIYLISYLDLFLQEYRNTNVFYIYDEISYIVNYTNKVNNIEVTNFTKKDLELGQDFPDHVLITSTDKIWDKIKEYNIELFGINYLKHSFKISENVFLFIFLIILNMMILGLKKIYFNNDYLNSEIKLKKIYIEKISNNIENLKSKKDIVVEEKSINQIFKKPLYLDIEKLLKSLKYEIEYTDIKFENNIWLIEGSIANLELLYNFENDLKKDYKNILVREIKDNNERIEFVYEIKNY